MGKDNLLGRLILPSLIFKEHQFGDGLLLPSMLSAYKAIPDLSNSYNENPHKGVIHSHLSAALTEQGGEMAVGNSRP